MANLTNKTRKRRSKSDWQAIIVDWAQSGKSQRHYCEDEGLCYQQFLVWRRRFENESDSVGFATLTVNSKQTTCSTPEASVEIAVANKFRVKVTDQSTPELLKMTLGCLEGLC